MPDADIPSELILEQLEEEEERTNRFNPYISNLLVSSVQQTTVDSAGGLIAFPMGEAMNELSAYFIGFGFLIAQPAQISLR